MPYDFIDQDILYWQMSKE